MKKLTKISLRKDGCHTNQKRILGRCWHKVLNGKKDVIKKIAENGVIAVNPQTKKFEKIDPDARYKIFKVNTKIYVLYSNKDLRGMALDKGFIL